MPTSDAKSRLSSVPLALALIAGTGAAVADVSDASELPTIEEVLVTAEKRGDKSLQDTALSAAVITGDLIDQQILVGMNDYLRTVPGATYQEYGAGRSTTVIRGVSADPQEGAETTGVYINEIPLTGTGDFGRSSPELKLVDVERIEILRGPQGTLYGSSSLGGTVRTITNRPGLDAFGGSLTTSLSHTGSGGGGNADAQAVLNLPIVPGELAVRAVAYYYDYSGNYRNVAASDPIKLASAARTGALVRDLDDLGRSTYRGGRVSVRWVPTDRVTLDLMMLEQEIEQEGVPYGDLRIGDFEHARYARFSNGRGEFTEDDLSIVNLEVNYDFGPVSLLSSTSWNDYRSTEDWDVGRFWTFFYVDDAPIYLLNNTITDNFAQELRLASQWDHPVNFLAGVYVEDFEGGGGQLLEWEGDPSADPLGGALLVDTEFDVRFKQRAVFGEVSWAFSDAWVATAGTRRFDYDSSSAVTGDGFFTGGPFEDALASSEDGSTYKLKLSYASDKPALYYAQWSEGFNPGGPLAGDDGRCDFDGDGLIDGLGLAPQEQLLSETMDSYELGAKLSWADGRANLRGAAYYNQWEGLPIALTGDCGRIFLFNAAEARTTGLELEGNLLLGSQWRLDFGVGYTQAELTSDAPGLGVDGDRLPGTPEFIASLGVEYAFAFRGREGYVRTDLASVGGFYNNLQEAGQTIGNYTTVNVVAGMDFGRWDGQLFIKNLGNDESPTWISKFEQYPSAFRLRPRTIGLSIRYSFDGGAR